MQSRKPTCCLLFVLSIIKILDLSVPFILKTVQLLWCAPNFISTTFPHFVPFLSCEQQCLLFRRCESSTKRLTERLDWRGILENPSRVEIHPWWLHSCPARQHVGINDQVCYKRGLGKSPIYIAYYIDIIVISLIISASLWYRYGFSGAKPNRMSSATVGWQFYRRFQFC